MAARCPYFAPEDGPRAPRAGESPAAALRRILASPGAHQAPCCFDALGARLVERAGFPICFMGGFCVSASRLGLPDVGLISYGEMIDQGRLITEAVSVPVIGDGDNGYGNSMNIKRTVKGYINAGFAGIMLEDQVAPKACGHTEGRKVVSREEAIMHINAAVDARKESGSDIVIVARTDSRQAISLDEALWRVQAFADAGADVLFIDALASIEEMKAFCAISPEVPKMANMLEGGGKTPILSPAELEEIGFRLVVYPLSLIGVSMRAMEGTGREQYCTWMVTATMHKGGGAVAPAPVSQHRGLPRQHRRREDSRVGGQEQKRWRCGAVSPTPDPMETGWRWDALLVIKGGRVPPPGTMPSFQEIKDTLGFNRYYKEEKQYIVPQAQSSFPERSHGGAKSRAANQQASVILRLKVKEKNGVERIDARGPAGFIEGVSKVIPGLAGVNIMEMLQGADNLQKGKVLVDSEDTTGDRVQLFID